MFVDELAILVRSGDGGRGCTSFIRRADRKRIPNGGNGGLGGNVVVRAKSGIGTLQGLKAKRKFVAENGQEGTSNRKHGRNGKSLIIDVPCGTTIYNKKDQLLIRDLVRDGDEVEVVKGGEGGHGNHADRPSTPGEQGKELELFLSYKILSDIAFIGLPNAGKTALLRVLTHAGVEPAEYPFSTLMPQLGTYETDTRHLQLCDLPSLYESSEQGGGVGTHFLKHLERTRFLFFVFEPVSKFAESLQQGYDILCRVLGRFNEAYLSIPRIIIINKCDLITEKERESIHLDSGERLYYVSAEAGVGLRSLMDEVSGQLEQICGTS